mmetsp:Transcript_118854/g.282032  ORF Transcript_118854/g.282032 Transcript_118854/m.282032 type:complete len:206 (+) Transcript_118854:444-1061(+)
MQHGNVVCAITDSNGLLDLTAFHVGYSGQQLPFSLWCHHWPRSLSRQESSCLIHLQSVGKSIVQAQILLNLLCHRQEATRNNCRLKAQALQTRAELLGTRGKDQVCLHLCKKFLRIVTFQQCHAGLQRSKKIEFATHRCFSNLLDLTFDSGQFSQLIDDLLLDQSRIHVKDHQPSHPPLQIITLNGNVSALSLGDIHEVLGELVR